MWAGVLRRRYGTVVMTEGHEQEMGDSGQEGETGPREGLTRLLLVGAIVTVVVTIIVGPGFARWRWTDEPDESPD